MSGKYGYEFLFNIKEQGVVNETVGMILHVSAFVQESSVAAFVHEPVPLFSEALVVSKY